MQLIFPAVALAYSTNAVTARVTRSQMLEVLREDYIRTAMAKGLRERVVIYRHALKNASLPVITLFGVQFATLLGGSVVIESVFSLPGIGRLLIFSINVRDYPMIQFLVTFIAFIFLDAESARGPAVRLAGPTNTLRLVSSHEPRRQE